MAKMQEHQKGAKVNQQMMRACLAESVRQAEQNILKLVGSGEARISSRPYEALLALAIHTGFVVEGPKIQMSVGDIMRLQQFIATCDEYVPSKQWPFTKEQMLHALEEVL